MLVASLGLYALGFGSMFLLLFRRPLVQMGLLTGYIFFATLQFGPHTVFLTEFHRYSETLPNPDMVRSVYNGLVGLAFLLISGCLWTLPERFSNVSLPSPLPKHDFRYWRSVSIIMAIGLISVSIALQPGLHITIEHLRVLLGRSSFGYTEVRRELYAETLWSAYASSVRFTVVPLAFAGLVASAIRSRGLSRWGYVAFAVVTPIIACIQVNKFVFIYYPLLAMLVYLCMRQDQILKIRWRRSVFLVVQFLVLGTLFMGFVYWLYTIQYRDILSEGRLGSDQLGETLVFRVFFASSEGLRLWISYFFVEGNPPAGISTIGKVALLFGFEHRNVSAMIPLHYFGVETTFQGGYLATGLAYYGWIGALMTVFAVISILLLNNYVVTMVRHSAVLVQLVPVLFLNSFFLNSRDLHKAVLSGGLISVCLAVWAISVAQTSLTRRRYVSRTSMQLNASPSSIDA